MSILAIKQGYIVNSVLFISFLFIISLGLIGGCSDGGGGNDSQALTENDFAQDSSLRADLDEGVVVTFLEAPNSEAPEKDTGEVGIDEIPVTYDKTTEQTFCWEDDDVNAMHFMELADSQESVILTVEANGNCVTEVIEAGNYLLSIHHDGSNEDSLPIFLIPDTEELEQARKTDGIVDRVNVVVANIMDSLQKTVIKDARAQTVMENIDTLLSTNRCFVCNLEGADFRDRNLSGVNLSGANLRGADLGRADLRTTNLSSANLRLANLISADLREANLRFSNLGGANLGGANMSGASWCDGSCVCAQESIGTCNGCAPVEEVCTGPTALTENDFVEDSSLRVELDEGVVVTSLESPGSEEEEEENDTGTRGVDDIPVIYEETTEQTFCWEDEDEEAMHFMELRDLEGNLILTLEANGDCVTQVIVAGDYVISIFHDGTLEDSLAIFLIPEPEELEESEQARKSDGYIDRISAAAVKVFKSIEKSVTRDARAQTQTQKRETLVNTNSCPGCNLAGAYLNGFRQINANLRGANLLNARMRRAVFNGADFTNANLRNADLREVILSDADLTGATLTGANLFNAILARSTCLNTNMSGAYMRNVSFNRADLTGANLSGAFMRNARLDRAICLNTNMSGANLSNAVLLHADLTSANLSGANLSNADMNNAICFSTNLSRSNLTDAVLSDAILTNATLNDATLNNARLNDASMIGARFNRANMTGANLSGAVSASAEFNDANLRGANFTGADSPGAFMRRANLTNANMTNANFSFANFTSANLTGVTLSNTDFSFTVWCQGTCRCVEASIDFCEGCTPLNFSSLDFCTGP